MDQIKSAHKKENFLMSKLITIALSAVFVVFSTSSLWAQIVPPIKTEDANTSVGAVVTGIGQQIQAKIQAMTADVEAVNNRNTAIVQNTAADATNNATPSSRSACHIAQSGSFSDQGRAATVAMGGAMTQSGGKRPNDPATNAKEIQAEMGDGLTPCPASATSTDSNGNSTIDADASNYIAMKCKPPSWGQTYVNADLSPDALFGSFGGVSGNTQYGLAVPPEFQNLPNGKYQPVPIVSSANYMPFIAAYSYCQRINPKRTPMSVAVAAHPTVDVLAAAPKNDADAKMDSAYSMCMNLLAERMQYGGSSKFPSLFQQQQSQCATDLKALWFDPAPNATCQTNGRSTLQAKHDLAYRDEFESYHAQYLASADRATLFIMDGFVQGAHSDFDNYVAKERENLTSAISAAAAAEAIGVNAPLAQPIQH